MQRLQITLTTVTMLSFLAGCTSTEEKASRVMDESLRSTSKTYKEMVSYPGNVTCGKYLDRDFQGFPVYKDFVVVDTEANLRPSELDLAIFCSDDPLNALNEALAIDYAAQSTEVDAILNDFRALQEPLLQYEQDNRVFPVTDQGLQALVEPSPYGNPALNFPEGGYISSVPRDPWGNDYDYDCPPFAGIRIKYKLQSFGADGVEGGTGQNADIKHSYLKYFDHLERL